jgi:hypothetical protein
VFLQRGIEKHDFSTILFLGKIDHLIGTKESITLVQKLKKAATLIIIIYNLIKSDDAPARIWFLNKARSKPLSLTISSA